MSIATFYNGPECGMNPFILDGNGIVTGSANTVPQQRPGCVIVMGNAEFQLANLTLAAVTNLTDGQVYVMDRDYNAALMTTANALRGLRVGVGRCNQTAATAGVHWIWLQIMGDAPVQAGANAAANVLTSSTTTAGQVDSATTTGSKQLTGMELAVANGATAGVVEGILNRPRIGATN